MKNNTGIAIVRDHSLSMPSLTKVAARDYNSCVSAIKDSCLREDQDAYVTVVKCGVGYAHKVLLDSSNIDIRDVQSLPDKQYIADGTGTPLFDSVGRAIMELKRHKHSTYLVMVITDGQGNSSVEWSANRLMENIRELQATDKWTFSFRVPHGYKNYLTKFGIPDGNILEWEQTNIGMETATIATKSAVSNYFSGVTRGLNSSKTFYTDLSGVTTAEIKQSLKDITNQVTLHLVKASDPLVIRKFMEAKIGTYNAGSIYYQLTKTESRVQEYKNIVVRDSKKGKYYSGQQARDLLGLPMLGLIRLVPGDHDKFDIFIQSTSYNRKLVVGTTVLVIN